LAEGHAALGLALIIDLQWIQAGQELVQAVSLNPNSAHAHMYSGWYLGFQGRFNDAIRELELAEMLEPVDVGDSYLAKNMCSEAAEAYAHSEEKELSLVSDPSTAAYDPDS
jgi:Flp pilus assembly protein TadD